MEITSIGTSTQGILDKIPIVIGTIREAVIKFLPEGYYPLVIAVLAVLAAFFWVKQFIASGFLKLSVLLNIILLSLLIYLVFVYI